MIKTIEIDSKKGKCPLCYFIKFANCDNKKCFPHERTDGKNVYFTNTVMGKEEPKNEGN